MSAIQLRAPVSSFGSTSQLKRDGIVLEKGVVLTEEWLRQHEDFLCREMDIFTVYPDILLDLYTPINSEFRLFAYQRINEIVPLLFR